MAPGRDSESGSFIGSNRRTHRGMRYCMQPCSDLPFTRDLGSYSKKNVGPIEKTLASLPLFGRRIFAFEMCW